MAIMTGWRAMLLRLARRLWHAGRRWWWHSFWQLQVTGIEHVPVRGQVVLCANHTSHLDAPAILAALPSSIALRTGTAAAKDVFGDHHLTGPASRIITNAVPIERGVKFASGLRALEGVLRERRPLIVFPEGGRSPDGRLRQFKPGAAMLAMRTGAPIVPVYLQGLHESLARGRYLPRPGRIRVRFGAALDPKPYRDAIADGSIDKKQSYQQLIEQVRAAICQMAEQE